MSFITPSKRPYDRNSFETNGRGKWQKSATFHSPQQLLNASPGATVFRLLCPASKSGGVIGKGGAVIMQIRQETGAKVKVEDTIPGCDERIIIIVGSDKDADVTNEQHKEEDEDDNKDDDDSNDASDEGDDIKENDESAEEKEISKSQDSRTEKATTSAQKALLLIFDKMVEGDIDSDEGDEDINPSSVFVRLLVLSSQVGCLLGKGGSVIKQMAGESGAQIRILPRDKLPSCASPSDELVQITGELLAVRKALHLVSQQLMENPPRDRDSFPTGKPTGPSSHQITLPLPEVHPAANFPFPAAAGPHHGSDFRPDFRPGLPASIPKFHESVISGQMNASEEVLTFRLLCADEKVGGVIGKGGSIIRNLKHETGCDIKILDAAPGSDDRIIMITAPAHPDERISPAQDAVLRVQSRIVTAAHDGKEKAVSSRLLVSSNQIGCLLGKGGAIIAEMRKLSRAHIRILGKDQIPTCASDNEEVVHITGEFEAVQEALLQITTRLRSHLFRDKFPAMSHLPRPAFPDQAPPFVPYMGRRDASPPRMYHNLGSSFHKFEPVGGFPPHDERSAFLHGVHRPGIPPHGYDRMPPSAPWGPQGIIDGGGPIGMPDYAGVSQRRVGGIGSGSQPAVITSTTVEVVVPRALVPSIYGEDGGCLKKIRQISGAKITITEPRPGATETAIIISGAPEETHAAQSLLQAFVMSGTDST